MSPDQPLLYDYWRSSACYRVRIVLNMKGIAYQPRPVHLVKDGGEQHQAAYRQVNPQGLIPALAIDGKLLSQSLAICEYLDERHPEPPLLPADPAGRASVRAMAQIIACDVHPLNNLRVQQYLKAELGCSDAASVRWMNHWMSAGFAALEARLEASGAGDFCYGDAPGLADCCLVPQVYNADRFNCDMSPFPRIRRVAAHCRSLPAFRAAEPERQPDAPNA